MADQLTVGGTPVYRDSAGVLREVSATATPTTNASAPAITSTYSMATTADGTNPTVVATEAVALVSVDAYNARTGGVSIQFYDKATAPLGSDAPKWTIYLPALTATNRVYPTGIRFSAGLAFTIVPDDASGVMAGDIQGLNLGYAA